VVDSEGMPVRESLELVLEIEMPLLPLGEATSMIRSAFVGSPTI
jgi:hypothetical protein